MAIIVTNESILQGDPTEEAIRQALAGMDLASVQDSTTASRYAVSSVDGANVPTLVGAQVGGNTGTQGGTTTQNIVGRDSVQAVTMANLVTVNLLNDALAPGNTYYYGTGPTGTKGWNTVASALAVASTSRLTQTIGANGVSTFDLAMSGVVADPYGDSTHVATFTVDAYGRLAAAASSAIAFPVTSVFGRTGAVAAASGDYNTGQVTEGTNLYFTAARVLATVLAGLSTATNAVITAADTVLSALGKLQAQISANVTALAGKLTASNNLSDLANNATAVANLHVGFSNVSVALTISQTGIAVGSYNTVIFNSVVLDTLSEYNATTGSFTAKSSGLYLVAMFVFGVGLLDGCNVVTGLFVNGVQSNVVGEVYVRSLSGSVGGGAGASTLVQLTANDVLTIGFFVSNASSPYIQGIPATTYARIYRIL